jgi:hypothetical protein
MEKQNEESVLQCRSSRACIADGFKCYLGSFKRIFRATWLPSLAFAIVSGLAEALLVIYYPLVVAILLLVYFIVYRFLIRRRLKLLGTSGVTFGVALRHSGLIAVVALVTIIICAVAWMLTSVPALILGVANIQAQGGALYGDPLGMPDYMLWLTIGVFTLASFMQAYIYLAYFFPMRYALGSAVANEHERQEALNKIKQSL